MTGKIDQLASDWMNQWETALAVWSRFTKLSPPRLCTTKKAEKQEGLTDAFAMIRLTDHAVVVGLKRIVDQGLEDRAVEILAHEIGHHILAPADLTDNARLLARVRAGLPSRENLAPLVANLYTDLMINDRLQRSGGLDMAGVYRRLAKSGVEDPLWNVYLRMYELLWRLESGTLTAGKLTRRMETDAGLGARLIRVYAKNWLDGAGRFAALLLTYLLEIPEQKVLTPIPWLDAIQAGAGGGVPDGLAGVEPEEADGAIHPAEDPEISGVDDRSPGDQSEGGREEKGGQKDPYRTPSDYEDLMRALGVTLPPEDLTVKYYQERARPHLVPFPQRKAPESYDPLPEGLDSWEAGMPLGALDWVETISRGPWIIPGYTTVKRAYGRSEGSSPETEPVDLFLGVDCSGSMFNPRFQMSYPVLAAVIMALSALRAGARVKAVLSGEPGEYSQTDGFVRDEKQILRTLTGYLGTGYAFGVKRLKETFLGDDPVKRPTHILVVTDTDIFSMLKQTRGGWRTAKEALEAAGGGGTYVLHRNYSHFAKQTARMEADGWRVHNLEDWADLTAFARAFSRERYGPKEGAK